MEFEFYIYLSILAAGVISAAILLSALAKSVKKFPESWRNSSSLKTFRRSILFLHLYLLIIFICECIAIYLAKHQTYNSYVMAISSTLATLCLFGFLYINTQTIWRQYSYIALYVILVGYFISGGYYHPHSIFTGSSSLVMHSIYFFGAFVHLTELLINPKADHFRFQLKINLCLLVYAFFADILNSFFWYMQDLEFSPRLSRITSYIHISNICLYYLSFSLIFLSEILKLNRKRVKSSKH